MKKSGYSLIEVILSLALFALALPAIGHVFGVAIKQESDNTLQTQALFLANGLMEEISQNSFQEDSSNPGNCVETGELSSYSRASFDDIDDYAIFSKDCNGTTAWGSLSPPRDQNGTSLTDFSKFSQYVQVKNITPPTSGPTTRTNYDEQSEGTTSFKLVTVSILWDSNRRSVTLHKVFAKP